VLKLACPAKTITSCSLIPLANEPAIAQYVQNSLMLVTALKEAVVALSLLPPEQFDKIVVPLMCRAQKPDS